MSNVVSMERPCEYLVHRAAVRRRAGNYDEAMTLLSKAKDQFGPIEAIELELARTYDEMECEEEASRAYLRVVRLGGQHKAEALINLCLASAQRADLVRAMSYFEQFTASDRDFVSPELAQLLGEQLREQLERPVSFSQRGRARALVRRAVERMQEGRTAAAKRTLCHALAMRPSAQGYTLLACCHLLRGEYDEAVRQVQKAYRLAPSRVQTLCVMADAYAAAGDEGRARRALYLAALRAKETDDVLGVALESAKRGEDRLTLRLTETIIKREPFHTRAMMLRACALTNLGQMREASRLFGRLCVLLPENTVCETFYRLTREGEAPDERLSLGLDVTHREAVLRAMQLVAALYMEAEELRRDPALSRTLCRLSAWAFRSALAGDQVATVALIVMSMLNTPMAQETLFDALTDPQVDDAFKCRILQVVAQREGIKPYPVDMGGRLVHLAAGGTTERAYGTGVCREVVQRAADVLTPSFRDAPQVLLPLWIAYLDVYGPPKGRCAPACAAALEYVYHTQHGREVDLHRIARRSLVSPRLCRLCVRRILRAQQIKKRPRTDESEERREGAEDGMHQF